MAMSLRAACPYEDSDTDSDSESVSELRFTVRLVDMGVCAFVVRGVGRGGRGDSIALRAVVYMRCHGNASPRPRHTHTRPRHTHTRPRHTYTPVTAYIHPATAYTHPVTANARYVNHTLRGWGAVTAIGVLCHRRKGEDSDTDSESESVLRFTFHVSRFTVRLTVIGVSCHRRPGRSIAMTSHVG